MGQVVWGSDVSAGNAFGNSRSFGYTVPTGVFSILLARVWIGGGSGLNWITYNGVAMTQKINQYWGCYFGIRQYLYYTLIPPTGSHTFAYSLTANCTNAANIATYHSVNQTTPFGTQVTALGQTQYPSVVANSASGEIVIDGCLFNSGSGTSITMGPGQTERHRQGSSAGTSIGHGFSEEPGAGSNTMSWTLGVANCWMMTAVPLKASVGGSNQAIWCLSTLKDAVYDRIFGEQKKTGIGDLGNFGLNNGLWRPKSGLATI